MGRAGGSVRRALSLPAHPSSAGTARTLTEEVLATHQRGEWVESARLLVSELVTNSVVHAGTPLDVELDLSPDALWVQVRDGSPHLPMPRHYAPDARTGRGLSLLRELATSWGVEVTNRGKAVWFRLGVPDARPAHAGHEPAVPAAARPGAAAVGVRLLNVPLLLCRAWRQHTESLLREYLLAQLDHSDGIDPAQDPILLHAAATEAITVVAEHISALASSTAIDDGSTATEPAASLPCVDLEMPVPVVARFETLEALLDAAGSVAATGRLLAPPVQPEVRALTRWVCGQVREQARGGLPTPWSLRELPPPPPQRVLAWDAAAVTDADSAQVASDDTGRIVAASRPALRMLGYESRSQLVGRRVLALIPDRYRQAHLAGFTLSLLHDRRGPVTSPGMRLPALCADGVELPVRIAVQRENVIGGRIVFIATLTPA